jgi:hypothetical protein
MGEKPSSLRDVHRPERNDEALDNKIARELESATPVDMTGTGDKPKLNEYGELEE